MSTVIARDRIRGYVLVTGVGFARVGTMWYQDNAHFQAKDGYASAPERSCDGEFGTPECWNASVNRSKLN